MKTRFLALKVALNSAFVIIIAFTLVQIVNYARDSIIFQTGSLGEFLASYAGYMGTRVMPVLVVFTVIIFFRARPLELTLSKLEAGEPVAAPELARVRAGILRLPYLIIILNVIGFSAGFILDLVLGGQLGQIYYFDRLSRLIFNVSSGVVYATAQNAINSLILSGPRELLKIEHLDREKKESGVRQRAVVLTLFLAVYVSLFLLNNNAYVVEQEMILGLIFFRVS